MKRLVELSLGEGWNPATKVEFGERRVRFWEGCHGESEMENVEKD